MLLESLVNATVIDSSGALKDCVEVCTNCPRRTGIQHTRPAGLAGILKPRIKVRLLSNPLESGQIVSFQTNGQHGIFYGHGNENTGTVTGLRTDNAPTYLEAITRCVGPYNGGNICRALGPISLYAICDLDRSAENMIDTFLQESRDDDLPSLSQSSAKFPAHPAPATRVVINNSMPSCAP